ncbi:MAG: DUF6273 domain-containing protein [Clostridiales bacterium]|nr:DUF6273 domain-containing protein [Clostridiales bacterium]
MKKSYAKRLMMLLVLSAVFLFVLTACGGGGKKVEPPAKAGDIMQFGGHDWLVLEVKGNKALVISNKVLEKRPYHGQVTNISWTDCDLRKYLNNDFYNSFSLADSARITATTTAVNASGEETKDWIFLLSYDEANKYFASNSKRIALDAKGTAASWLLRSPGFNDTFAAVVDSGGSFSGYGCPVSFAEGVRPALWLNL